VTSRVRMTQLSEAYAACVRYIFANADFSSAGRRYQNPIENWKRFESLLDKLGRPLQHLKVVHIAGTNGKGTTSALCDAMLRASGKRVGLFTSPHLHSFRERIRLDGRLVSKEAVVAAMDEVRPVVDAIGYASPFEKLSALAFVCFARENMEWAVLETGLGGRWDCTNHCKPLVCGITRIGMDHMNVLGNTVAEIAGEKAGIIKKDVPAFCVPQEPSAIPVLHAAAADAGTTLHQVEVSDEKSEPPFWLSPAHQQLNASLACTMVHSLAVRGLLAEQPDVWRSARDHLLWPARFEVITPKLLQDKVPKPEAETPTVMLLDVAHNLPAVEALLASVEHAYPNAPLVLIFGANRDKDVHSMAQLFANQPNLHAGVAVVSGHPKAIPADEVVTLCNATASTQSRNAANCTWRAADNMLDAVSLAGESIHSQSSNGIVLCCGSVFVAADMRAALAEVEPGLFVPADSVFESCAEPHLLM
ncbi:MAG: hypothetical protein SGPRY_012636, partial [Prymnesium sp.]